MIRILRFSTLENLLHKLTAGLAFMGGLGLLFAAFTTCLSILMKLARQGIDALAGAAYAAENIPWLRSILGEEELVSIAVGFALYTALPWVMLRRGHICVDLFAPLFGKRGNRVLDLIADIALTIIAYLILTRQWFLLVHKPRGGRAGFWESLFEQGPDSALLLLRNAQQSQVLGLPLWPTYLIAQSCTFILFLVSCFCVLRSIRTLAKHPC